MIEDFSGSVKATGNGNRVDENRVQHFTLMPLYLEADMTFVRVLP
jgi:hypothetical protein